MSSSSIEPSAIRPGFLVLLGVPVFAVIGNCLVVIAVLGVARLRSNHTNLYIASLATSDFLIGLVVMPFGVYLLVNNEVWTLGEDLCLFYLATDVAASTVSILNLVIISIDRFGAIMFPRAYQDTWRNPRRALIIIALLWVSSTSVAIPFLIHRAVQRSREKKLGIAKDRYQCEFESPDFIIYSSIFSFYVPALIVVAMYGVIFLKLRVRSRKKQKSDLRNVSPATERTATPNSNRLSLPVLNGSNTLRKSSKKTKHAKSRKGTDKDVNDSHKRSSELSKNIDHGIGEKSKLLLRAKTDVQLKCSKPKDDVTDFKSFCKQTENKRNDIASKNYMTRSSKRSALNIDDEKIADCDETEIICNKYATASSCVEMVQGKNAVNGISLNTDCDRSKNSTESTTLTKLDLNEVENHQSCSATDKRDEVASSTIANNELLKCSIHPHISENPNKSNYICPSAVEGQTYILRRPKYRDPQSRTDASAQTSNDIWPVSMFSASNLSGSTTPLLPNTKAPQPEKLIFGSLTQTSFKERYVVSLDSDYHLPLADTAITDELLSRFDTMSTGDISKTKNHNYDIKHQKFQTTTIQNQYFENGTSKNENTLRLHLTPNQGESHELSQSPAKLSDVVSSSICDQSTQSVSSVHSWKTSNSGINSHHDVRQGETQQNRFLTPSPYSENSHSGQSSYKESNVSNADADKYSYDTENSGAANRSRDQQFVPRRQVVEIDSSSGESSSNENLDFPSKVRRGNRKRAISQLAVEKVWFLKQQVHVLLRGPQTVGVTRGSTPRRHRVYGRERKATKLVAVVLMCFLCCWSPFFFFNLYRGICLKTGSCQVTDQRYTEIFVGVTWIGYMNSVLNPVLYTLFNAQYRDGFRKIFSCQSQ